jgi:hypothetical protein
MRYGRELTLTIAGRATKFSRVTQSEPQPAGAKAGGSHPAELAGKWCYQSNVYANNGGARSASTCLVLNADGTYQYSAQSDNYNPNGSLVSDTQDYGTWTATENSISVVSKLRGPLTFTLEKRNHPKNGDPMLIIDGKALVTFYKKAPWR